MIFNSQIFIIFLASVNLLLAMLVFFRLRQPTSIILWALKVFTSAVSPFLFLIGILTVILGWISNSLPATVIGGFSAILFLIHIIKITRPSNPSTGFENVFGTQWEVSIPQERKAFFLPKRYVLLLLKSPDPILEKNISFHTLTGTDRELLCDVWQPPRHIKHSGLVFIYLHGSAWTVWDKDRGTRKFFRRLASQGHVIMDVAYRLFPETDFMGMVHDAKYAIAWMKANSATYDINPDRIVISGGSAGGHIAMLAAYTDRHQDFSPKDLEDQDVSVRGIISLYGPSDLVATYYHTRQDLTSPSELAKNKNTDSVDMPKWIRKRMGDNYHDLGFDKDVEPGMLAPMLGGSPGEKPEAYSLFSPIAHVHKGCPQTLLIQGEQDILVPGKAIRNLYARLSEEKVPVVMHILPQTDHAFDLILPKISPSAHNAIFDIERFMALLV